jgi:hypothetical protein
MAKFDNSAHDPSRPANVPLVAQEISYSTADVERGLFYTTKFIPTEYSTIIVVVPANVLVAGGPLLPQPGIVPSDK